MTRGRPRKPISVLKQQGTYNSTRHADRVNEPSSDSAVNMPNGLGDDAAKFWRRVVPKLSSMGVLDGIDETALIGLSTAYANWQREQRLYEAGESKITSVCNAWSTFDKIACKFGMNPVDRTKLATAPPEAEDDPFTEWLAAKRALN